MNKRIGQSGFQLAIIPLVIVIIGMIGFVGWYVWDSNKKDKQESNVAQNKPSTIQATPTATPSPTQIQQASQKNELDTLRDFCQGTDPNTVVGNIIYAETVDGKFASCGVGDKNGGGATLIAYIVDGKWTKIIVTQHILTKTICDQYKLPGVIGFCYEAELNS